MRSRRGTVPSQNLVTNQKGREVMNLGEEARKELEVDSGGGYDHKCYIHV